MPATTSSGWPYVEGGDAVHDYPVTSKALADKLGETWADSNAPWHICTGVAPNNAAVTFSRPFSETPVITFGMMAWLDPNQPLPTVTAWNQSATGFKTLVRLPNGTPYTGTGVAYYIAIGPS